MSTFNTPLDITVDPKQILMDALNYENRTSYQVDDFIFSSPEPATLENTTVNTRILLTPKIGSNYYNPRYFHYERMNLAGIVATRFMPITITTQTLLSELIQDINNFYGINLKADDYIEQSLPVFDPQNPQALTVVLQAKAESILFEGAAVIKLNEAAPAEPTDNYDRFVFFIMDKEDKTIWKNTLNCLSGANALATTFQALRNATNITEVQFDNVQVLPNKTLLVRGVFKFDANINGSVVTYNTTSLVLSKTGDVIYAGNLFGNYTVDRVAFGNNDAHAVIVDSLGLIDPVSVNHVHQYTLDGQRVVTWSIPTLTYKPDSVYVDDEFRVYTVSPVYQDTGSKVRIDRFLPDGSEDQAFVPIILSMTDGTTPFAVNAITFDSMGKIYLGLTPIALTSSIGPVLMINGTAVIPGNTTQVYGYLPVFRFEETGTLDSAFVWEQKEFMPGSILETNGNTLANAKGLVSVNIQGITYLTYAENWVTGVKSIRPVSYSPVGAPVLLSGKDHYDMPYWDTGVTEFLGCRNGKSYIYGQASFRNPAGGDRVVKDVVAIYRADSSFDKIVFTAPTVAGPALKITKAALFEFAY